MICSNGELTNLPPWVVERIKQAHHLKVRTPRTVLGIHAFRTHLLGKYFVPNTVRGNWDAEETKSLPSWSLHCKRRDNKYAKIKDLMPGMMTAVQSCYLATVHCLCVLLTALDSSALSSLEDSEAGSKVSLRDRGWL